MNIPHSIEMLNKLGEQTKIEAKTGKQVGKSILETICAFANEPNLGGGTILLGIEKQETPNGYIYSVAGITEPEKIIDDLVSQCRSVFNHPIQIQCEQQIVDGKVVIGIFVPEVSNGNKPIYFKHQSLPQSAFRRMGSSDVHCTEDDLLILYQQREIESFDYTALPDTELADIDPEAVEDYRKSREEVYPNAEELRWPDHELLQALGCLRKVKDQLIPTIAGILLFGTAKALRRLFPLMRVDYIRVAGKQWVGDPERRYTGVEVRAPIMSAIRRILAAIIDDLPKTFSLPEGSAQRQDIPIIPIVVIREAVVNALMHRNYRIHQPIQIIRYSNRIEIRNPGYSLIAEEQLGEPGSKSRNTKIAEALHETRFAETKGSGIRIMRENMQAVGLSPPFFESDRSRDLFVVTFLFHHFLGEDDLQWLANFKELHLSDEQARALIFTKETGAINNSAYRDINQVDTLAASISLRNLRDLGLLEAKSQGPATYYIPTDKLLAPLAQRHQLEGQRHQLEGQRHQLEGQRHQLESLDLPEEIKELVAALGKKPSASQLRQAIFSLCKWQEMTPLELTEILKRDKKRLVRDYLTPMIKEGLLIYRYPQMAGHPAQAYRANKKGE